MTREKLLLIPHWNAKQIMAYVDCKKTKAYEIMATVKKFYNGTIIGLPSCVKRDSVLVYLGTSIEHENYIIETLQERRGT